MIVSGACGVKSSGLEGIAPRRRHRQDTGRLGV